MKKFYNNLMNANLNLEVDTQEYKRVRVINFIAYLTVLIAGFLIKDNYDAGQVLFAKACTLSVFIMGFIIIYLRSQKNIFMWLHILLFWG
jgi:hypothetical protein